MTEAAFDAYNDEPRTPYESALEKGYGAHDPFAPDEEDEAFDPEPLPEPLEPERLSLLPSDAANRELVDRAAVLFGPAGRAWATKVILDKQALIAERDENLRLAWKRFNKAGLLNERIAEKEEELEQLAGITPEFTEEEEAVSSRAVWITEEQASDKEAKREEQRRQRRLKRDRSDAEATRILLQELEAEGLSAEALQKPPRGRPTPEQREQRRQLARVFARCVDAGIRQAWLSKRSNRAVSAVSELVAEGRETKSENPKPSRP